MLSTVLALGLAMNPKASVRQVVHVRLINGNTGKAVAGAKVGITTSYGYAFGYIEAEPHGDGYTVQLDSEPSIGLGLVFLKNSGLNQYRLCATGANLNPIYVVSGILASGLASPNECNSRVSVAPKPGEMIFYVQRLSPWRRMLNSMMSE